ncbi:MAG: hypothetical protein ABIR80_07700 [Opitutaceae bacterium]
MTETEIVALATRLTLANDIPAALRALEREHDPRKRSQAATAVVAAVAKTNPAQAGAIALALPAEPARTVALEIAGRAWAQRDADAALRWALNQSDPTAAHAARSSVTAELVHENARAALARIAALPANSSRDDMLGLAAAWWARREADDALAWLRELPDAGLRQRLTPRIAFAIAQTDPPRALALTETLPAGRERWVIVSAIAQTWTAVNPKAAEIWAAKIPAGPEREAALAGLQVGVGEPNRYRNMVFADSSRMGLPGGERDGIFATWLANQPRAMSHDDAILEFIRQRGSLDPAGIGTWVAGLSDWATRRRAMEIFLEESLRVSPARTADWLRSLPGGERTDEMVEKTARQWLPLDPRAAEAWLRETNLPPDRQEELLRQTPR